MCVYILLFSLTISLAGVVYSAEVLVTAALVGAFGVVADVGTNSKLLALVLICETSEGDVTDVSQNMKGQEKHCDKISDVLTFTSILSGGLEAGLAGAERDSAVDNTVCFVSISAHG